MVIISKTNLKKISNISRPYVFVPLAADILHHGHINILKKSNLLGSVIVGLITDKGLETYKGKPLLKFKERKLIVKSIKYIDFIIPLNGLFFKEIIDEIKPDYFVHGDDWKRGPQKNARNETLQSMKKIGGKVIEIKYTKGVSSTKIKKFISQKNLLK